MIRHVSCALLLLCLSSTGAHAQPTRAAQLFDEARSLLEQRDYAHACVKLEESQRLDPQLGTQLHLGHCYEKQGQLVRAQRAFLDAAAWAAARNAQGHSEPREKLARERAASIEPQLAQLELRLTNPPPDLRITLDGAPIERIPWGRALAIDPGEHLLQASARGRSAWRQDFTAIAGARLVLAIPALDLQPLAAAPVQLPAAPSAPSAVARDSGPSLQRVLGYVTLGAGVLGVGLGSVLGLMRNAKVDALEQRCDFAAGRCMIANGDVAAREHISTLRADATSYATGANLAWILGGVAAASGLVLILTAPMDESPALTLGVTWGGLSLTARSDAL